MKFACIEGLETKLKSAAQTTQVKSAENLCAGVGDLIETQLATERRLLE
jgi:hypothetical protein